MIKNVHYVDYTHNATAMTDFFPQMKEAYNTGVLCEELSDLIEIEILKGYNSDGSDRMIIKPL